MPQAILHSSIFNTRNTQRKSLPMHNLMRVEQPRQTYNNGAKATKTVLIQMIIQVPLVLFPSYR